MDIRTDQKLTKLSTKLIFEVVDMRGQHRFPNSQNGYIFRWKGAYGLNQTEGSFVVRISPMNPEEWRIDQLRRNLTSDAIYGPNQEVTFPTKEAAAQALEMYVKGKYTRGTLLQIATP